MAAVEANTGKMDSSDHRTLGDVKKGYTAFKENDVLFAKITPCMENGKFAVARDLLSGLGFGSTEFHVLRAEQGIESQLLYYYLSQSSFRRNARAAMTGSAGQLRVPASFLSNAHYLLPPTNEQHRIVSVLEEQFTRLDAAIASLRQDKARLKQARASVLKAAVEGTLTETWRASHPDVEPAEELLERILLQRREKWEADLRAKGKDPAKVKYVEPVEPDTEGLPELPEEWCWATVEQLSNKVVDGTHRTPTYIETGIPFLSVKDIRDGHVYFDDCKYISEREHEELSLRCHPELDDVLITKSGTIGRVAVVDSNRPFSLFVSVALVKTIKPYLNQSYFKFALEYYILKINVQQDIKGVAIKNLHLEDLRIVALRLPPLAEQQRIVAEAEQRLSVIAQAEAVVVTSLKRAERTRQSILQKAFSGQLVPQDPDDEPASVLLARIREEREQREQGRVNKKQRMRTANVPHLSAPETIDAKEMQQEELWQEVNS